MPAPLLPWLLGNPLAEILAMRLVRVNLLQLTQLLPHQCRIVEYAVAGKDEADGSYLLEPALLAYGLQVDPSLLYVATDQVTLAVVSNPTGCSLSMEEGSALGEATPVAVVCPTTQESQTRLLENCDGSSPGQQHGGRSN